MNHRINAACWLSLLFIAVAGCNQSTPTPINKPAEKRTNRNSSLEVAVGMLRDADGGSNYREALDYVNSHYNKSRTDFVVTPEVQTLLVKRFGLQPDDLSYVKDPAFRPLDANYLEGCFLLRDAARAVEQKDVPPSLQVRLAFEWLARNVLVTEQDPSLLPAAFVLARGYGNSWEQSFLGVELLRQLGHDGAIITARAKDRTQLLVGVVDATGTDLELFDARVGRAVDDTFASLRKKPNVEVAAFAVAPLPSLSPRMKRLHDDLFFRDQVVLAIDVPAYLERLEKAAGQPVRIWSNVDQPETAPRGSPLFALRDSIPDKARGMNQLRQFLDDNRIPWPQITASYARLRLVEPQFTAEAKSRLMLATQLTFARFVSGPREFLLRGQYDRIHRRLEGIQSALNDLEHVRFEESEFIANVTKWRERINEAYLAVIRANELDSDEAKASLERLWSEDQYFLFLLSKDGVPKVAQEGGDFRDVILPKGILTFIVLEATHAPLEHESMRLFAQMWQEKAEAAQASVEALKAREAPADALERGREKAHAAWLNARGQWNRYLDRFYFSPQTVQARTAIIERTEPRTAAANAELLLDHVMKSAHAKISLIRAHHFLGDDAAAEHHRTNLLEDLQSLQKNTALAAALKAQTASAPADVAAALRNLEAQFTGEGAVYWLLEQARAQGR